jgi:cytochrome c-type biogenesis protein CcmH
MLFWILTFSLVLATGIFVGYPMMRGASRETGSAKDVDVYRDQLAEVERDLARGILDETEFEATKTEVSRRLLHAADRAEAARGETAAPRRLSLIAAIGVAIALIVGTLGVYYSIGNPSMPDRPLSVRLAEADAHRANRPSQAEAEARIAELQSGNEPAVDAQYLELVDKLRKAMEERPGEIEGLRLLALHLPRIGEWAEAAKVQQKLVDALGDQAGGEDYADLAENLIVAAGGYVSPEAENALEIGMQNAPTNPRLRFYAGHALLQSGRPDLTYNLWARLLEEGPDDAPWNEAIRAQIGEVAAAIGAPVPGAAPKGPSQSDIEAAGEMSEGDRQQMIETMVAGLADRLATKGGPAEDWARLIRAYGVLGETAKASAIWNEAQEVFSDEEQAMAALRSAARDAGVAQ